MASEALNTLPHSVQITEHQLEVLHFLCNHGEYCLVSAGDPKADFQSRVQAAKNNYTVDNLVAMGLVEDTTKKVLAGTAFPPDTPKVRAFSATQRGLMLFNDELSSSNSVQ